MRKFMYIVICLSLVISLIKCKNSNKGDSRIKDYEAKIKNLKKSFEKEPFESISSTYNINYLPDITYPSGIAIEGYCGLIFNYKPDKQEFDSVSSLIKTKSKYEYHLTESQKFYVPSYEKRNKENKLPILNIYNPEIPLQVRLDKENSNIFIINYEAGNFFSKKGVDEVNEWTNIGEDFEGSGYSNGAIVDYTNNYIIFWTIIW